MEAPTLRGWCHRMGRPVAGRPPQALSWATQRTMPETLTSSHRLHEPPTTRWAVVMGL